MAELLRDCDDIPISAEVRETLDATGFWRILESAKGFGSLDITASGTYTIEAKPDDEVCIRIAPNIDVTLRERASGSQLNVLIKEGSSVKYFSSGPARRFVYLEAASDLDWIDVASTGRSESTAYLAGSGASAKYRSLFAAAGDESYDVDVRIIHKGSHTTSNMLTRAALLGRSVGKYRGAIQILPGARSCDAHQREDTLLLGDHARMDALPVLEIADNDVKCSHGVTLGQVDDEQLFYLESRGIRRDDAVQMIVSGFFDQLLISIGESGNAIRQEFLKRIGGIHG